MIFMFLSYKGTVLEEMVSKNKVQAYFDYFKKYNPLFGDEILDMERIDNLIEELKSTQEHENHDNNIDPMQEKIDEGRTNIQMNQPNPNPTQSKLNPNLTQT